MIFICLGIFSGCSTYKYPTGSFYEKASPMESSAANHGLYQITPRHRSQLYWYDLCHRTTWMLFGNDDDGIFGEGPSANYRPNQPPCFAKAVAWWFRNPLHNFCFYVIGSAHRENTQIDIFQIVDNKISGLHYRPEGTHLFEDGKSSFHVALHGGKPFISLRLCYHPNYRADFYIGWRERGNFGIKILPFCRNRY
jgi:hypothetical protein